MDADGEVARSGLPQRGQIEFQAEDARIDVIVVRQVEADDFRVLPQPASQGEQVLAPLRSLPTTMRHRRRMPRRPPAALR
jgi:hypothetical protein